MKSAKELQVAAISVAAMTMLSGCESSARLTPDFGQSVRQDIAAQITDPEGVGRTAPAAKGDGARVALAQDRYQKNKVIPPQVSTTSGFGSNTPSSGSGGSGSGN